MSMAQEVKTLDDYSEVRFYGIDFAPVKVVAASETVSEFIDAFGKINNLFLTEPDKYIIALEDRLKKKIVYVDIDNVVNQISAIDESELKNRMQNSNFRTWTSSRQKVSDLSFSQVS